MLLEVDLYMFMEGLELFMVDEPLLPVGVLEPKALLPLPIFFTEESRYLVPPGPGDLGTGDKDDLE